MIEISTRSTMGRRRPRRRAAIAWPVTSSRSGLRVEEDLAVVGIALQDDER